MDFEEDDFEIKILNTGEMVHNMEQFVRAAGRKSWNFKRNRCGMRRLIIPGFFEPPVRILRAAIPENESHAFR